MAPTAPHGSALSSPAAGRAELNSPAAGRAGLNSPAARRAALSRPARSKPALSWPALRSVLALLAGLCGVTGHGLLVPSVPPALAATVLAGAALAAVLAAVLAGGGLARVFAAVPQVGRASALREKSWLAAFGRQRDPDAAGRPRPRAPAAAPAAACP